MSSVIQRHQRKQRQQKRQQCHQGGQQQEMVKQNTFHIRLLRSYIVIIINSGMLMYTLPQKKRNFNFQIFHGNPGPGSMTLGYVHQGKCSWEQHAKDPIEKYQRVLSVHSIM